MPSSSMAARIFFLLALKSGRSLAMSRSARVTFSRAVYWGKRLKLWKTRPKCRRLLGGGVGGVEERLPPDDDAAGVGGLQEVQAAQEGGLAAAGGADDGQDLALVQREVDVFQDLGGPEVFFNVLYV